ncbi:MAG: sulfite exporter TauE/SafE family protein [Gammaproteobacteria bacterium]|nr:sulfite exporter TauE/SafE family protein [Gammaproteobacteria bacterium]
MIDIYVWFGAALVGLSLGLLGAGGSILTVPLLVYLAKEPEKLAIIESLFIVGTVALVASISHFINRNVSLKETLAFGIPSMFTAYLGAYAAQFVSGQSQMLVFAVVMILAAGFMLKPKQSCEAPLQVSNALFVKLLLSGLVVGAVAGFVGVGGGFLIVPALILFAGLEINKAVATSLVIIVMQSVAALLKYQEQFSTQDLVFHWPLVLLITACAVVGVSGGLVLSKHVPQPILKKAFAVMLIPFAAFIFVNNL